MLNNSIFSALSDILTCSALFMLAVYHSMIYWGRQKEAEEIYNLYFSIFILSATAFIVAPYFQPEHLLFSYKPLWLTVPNIEAFAVWSLFFSGTKFLNLLLKVPLQLKRYFQITYITVAISFLLTLVGNFVSLDFYFKNFLSYVLLIVAFNVFLIYAVYGYWVYQQKLMQQNFYKIVYIGFIALTLNIFIYRTIELLTMPTVLVWGHFITAIILYIFAYALSVKFNTEYFELKALKVSLERKVEERTLALEQSNRLLENRNFEVEKQKEEILTINNELNCRAEELFQLNQNKTRFFTGISHEFRTPLTLIIGPLENRLKRLMSGNAEDELMLRQARRLLSLINQLLEISKLQRGIQSLSLEQDDFYHFLNVLVASFGSMAKEKNISLRLLTHNIFGQFYFDKDKAEKIFTNLISNALKFTPAGGSVTVSVDKSADRIEVKVMDTGIGIDEEKLPHIFEMFYQIESSDQSNGQGSGIGLALVNELVDVYGGKISVTSASGSGTTFIVSLPMFLSGPESESVAVELPDVAVPADENLHGQFTVLVVEDHPDMRAYITSCLPDSYKIIEAENGQLGFGKACEEVPDIIISDVMMPVRDGLWLTQSIKQDERTSHIPIFLLTAKVSIESKLEGLSLHADDYIAKPFNAEELNLRISNMLIGRERVRAKFGKAIVITPSELSTSSMDEQFLQRALLIVEKFMDDHEFTAEQFCDEMNMSRTQVHRKLKALTGESTTHFIRSIRLKRAAQLLKNKTASVSEIAYQSGFNNLSYFTKSFKEYFSCLPSEYN